MLIEQLPILQIITIKNLAMNVSLLQLKSTIMKYIGILNFINHIVCMILCAIVIVLAIQNNSVFYFCASIVAMPLLLWNIMVFTEKLTDALYK